MDARLLSILGYLPCRCCGGCDCGCGRGWGYYGAVRCGACSNGPVITVIVGIGIGMCSHLSKMCTISIS